MERGRAKGDVLNAERDLNNAAERPRRERRKKAAKKPDNYTGEEALCCRQGQINLNRL